MKLIYRCFCLVMGAILGSGCSDSSTPVEYGPGPQPEYGVPTGTVRVDGRVLNAVGNGIEGVEVSFLGAYRDTTDNLGQWSIERENVYIPDAGGHDSHVTATDIDGPANGGPFPPVAVPGELVQTEPGSGSWDVGTWERHNLEITLLVGKAKESAGKSEQP